MTRAQMKEVMEQVFQECDRLRDAGQQEYAHDEEDALANFRRVAEQLGIEPSAVLITYFLKHVDGIVAFVRGHHSQREDVRGRISDAIVYLCLLRGMLDENEG